MKRCLFLLALLFSPCLGMDVVVPEKEEQVEKVAVVFFHKKKLEKNIIKKDEARLFARALATYVVSKKPKQDVKKETLKKVVSKVYKPKKLDWVDSHYLVYEEEKGLTRTEDPRGPAEKLKMTFQKILQEEDFKKKNGKIIVYTCSGSMKSLSLAIKDLPDRAIHTVVAIDSNLGSYSFDFNKIENRVFNFYTSDKRQLLEGLFDIQVKHSKAVNVLCYVRNEKGAVVPTLFNQGGEAEILSSRASTFIAGSLLNRIDQRYKVNNDLAAVLYSIKGEKGYGFKGEGDRAKRLYPAPFIYYPWKKTKKDGEHIYLKSSYRNWKELQLPFPNIVAGQLELENINNMRVVSDIITVVRKDDRKGIAGGSKVLQETFDRLEEVFSRYNERYMFKRDSIGPFFIGRNGRLHLVALVKNEFEKDFNIQVGPKKLEKGADVNKSVKKKEPLKLLDKKSPLGSYYKIVKADVTEKQGQDFYVRIKDKELKKGTIPSVVKKDQDFTFLVYGDLRKHDVNKMHKSLTKLQHDKTVAFETQEVIGKDLRGAFHLLTGDLVIDGGNIAGWIEYYDQILEPIVSANGNNVILTSALGNHDISSDMKPIPVIGKTFLKYYWLFEDAVPHFGNVFYFESDKKIPYTEHIEKTQNYFDMGGVRFIHLPLPTEDISMHYVELFGQKETYASGKTPLLGKTSGFNYNQKILEEFLQNLKDAEKEKEKGNIKAIIVYGHAPLVTSPGYKLSHKGMFNFCLENKEKLLKASKSVIKDKFDYAMVLYGYFKRFAIAAYFCGHNHVYDRCSIKIGDKVIPMVTVGIGTGLSKVHKVEEKKGGFWSRLFGGKEEKKEEVKKGPLADIKTHQFIYGKDKFKKFIGFLECKLSNLKNKIICTLFGPEQFKGGIHDEKKLDKGVYDRFEIPLG